MQKTCPLPSKSSWNLGYVSKMGTLIVPARSRQSEKQMLVLTGRLSKEGFFQSDRHGIFRKPILQLAFQS